MTIKDNDMACQGSSNRGKVWKYFLPWRFHHREPKHFENSGVLQLVFFLWMVPVIKKGLKRQLELEDLGELPPAMKVDRTWKRLKKYLCDEIERVQDINKISLLRIYLRYSGRKLLASLIMNIFGITSEFIGAVWMLNLFIEYLKSPEDSNLNPIVIIFIMFCCMCFRSINRNFGGFINYRTGIYSKSAFTGLIYDKILRLKRNDETSVGQLVNLSVNDTSRVMEGSVYLVNLVCFPFVLSFYIIYLLKIFGPSSLVGSGVLLIYIPFQVKIISTALSSIKLIKMYAWENSFLKNIYNVRKREKRSVQNMAFSQGFMYTIGYVNGFIAPLLSIITAIFVGEELSIANTLTMISIFNVMIFYGTVGPVGMKNFAELLVSFERMKKLLCLKDYEKIPTIFEESDFLIQSSDGSFQWEKRDAMNHEGKIPVVTDEKDNLLCPVKTFDIGRPILKNINLSLKKGELICICGSVGAGKSSLLQAFLSEMEQLTGELRVTDSIAYVPEEAWILNATIRENILMGEDYNEDLYHQVLESCSLLEDTRSMVAGDMTEIGERGINLSGGQKQRTSLARALYSQKDLYLLDDPLSAVDINVGKHIFQSCIKEELKDKGVILVTHQLQYLSQCHKVAFMKDGELVDIGKYDELLDKNIEFKAVMQRFYSQQQKHDVHEAFVEDVETEEKVLKSEIPERHETTRGGELVTVEEKKEGIVEIHTYLFFCRLCGGYWSVLVTMAFIFGSAILQILNEYWLAKWLNVKYQVTLKNNQNSSSSRSLQFDETDMEYYMPVYCGLAAAVIIFTILSTLLSVIVTLYGSSKLHNKVVKCVFNSPMSFFDCTPVGRIINRLSKDVDEIDNHLPFFMENFFRNFARTFGNVIFIGAAIPFLLIPTIPILLLFFWINQMFRKVVRNVKRIENISRSPLVSHVDTTYAGLSNIRAYNKEKYFEKKFHNHVNMNTLAVYMYFSIARFFAVSTEIICVLATLITTVAIYLLGDRVSPSLAGLCIVYSVNGIGYISWVFRLFTDFEARFTSVERLEYYVKNLDAEDNQDSENTCKNWPTDGSIQFKNVKLRYRDNLPFVLKDLSFEIKDKEKIGIVGRTGAGKSSLGVALYRLVNPQKGTIKIAGVDTQQIGLYSLRNAMTVIPQDPVLFIGTLRYNLDPFDEYSDDDLWMALEKSHIKDMVSELDGKLQHNVSENGTNFSAGEKQLICLARALLRDRKIILLDEASSSIDSDTDNKIQVTIQEEFTESTVLIIAHRLNTIMHCDRILVMDHGQAVEYDTPRKLLSKNSILKKMVSASEFIPS